MLRFLSAPSVAARPLSIGHEWLIYVDMKCRGTVNVQLQYTLNIFTLLIFMFPYPRRKEKGKAATPRDNSECTHSDCDRAGGADRPCNVEAFSDEGEIG